MLEVKRYLGSVKVEFSESIFPYFVYSIEHLKEQIETDKNGERYIRIYNRYRGTGITFIIYLNGDITDYEEELKNLFEKRTIFLKKTTIGKRPKKMQFVIIGQLVKNPDNRYKYVIRIEKGKIQMSRPMTLEYFENKYIRFYILAREKENLIKSLENIDLKIDNTVGERYIFSNIRKTKEKKIEWLDQYETVGIEF